MTDTLDSQAALSLQRYLVDQVATATPVQRLLMLFDQLRRDLSAAERGFASRDLKVISDHLVHAQEVLFALRDPLDAGTELGRALSGVYDFCGRRLLEANLRKDASLLPPVQDLIEQIATANRHAAAAMAAAPVGAAGAL